MRTPAPFTLLYLTRGQPSAEEAGVLRAAAEASGALFRIHIDSGASSEGEAALDPERLVLVGSSDLVAAAAARWPFASILPVLDGDHAAGAADAPEARGATILKRPLTSTDTEEAVRRAGAHAENLL